jgi:hypothetical protein
MSTKETTMNMPLDHFPPQQPHARIVTITPDYAAMLVGMNPRNRNISSRNFDVLVRALRNGEWQLNGEAIKIDINGHILDGQHRLRAVIETGISIETYLIEGLRPETQDTMDTGKSRGLNDVLAIRGEKNTSNLAAAIRRIYLYKRYGIKSAAVGSIPTTNHECIAFFVRNPDIEELLGPAKRLAKTAKLPTSLAAMLIYAFTEIDPEDAQVFFEKLETGIGLPQGHPIQILRETLRRLYDSRGATNQMYIAALVIKAWNKYRAGAIITLLKFTPGGANPEQFPEPK